MEYSGNGRQFQLAPTNAREVLLYRPMFWVRGSRPPPESSILFSFETDIAGG